eukprot:11133675-Ditylum_brightwellii.AAC.1
MALEQATTQSLIPLRGRTASPSKTSSKEATVIAMERPNKDKPEPSKNAAEDNNLIAETTTTNTEVRINNSANDRDDGVGEQQTTTDLLANAAANAMGAKPIFVYQTKIEFTVPEGKGTFNLCATFSTLMNEPLKTDRKIMIGSTDRKENKWSSARELLVGKKFNEAFTMRQETHKDKPQI